ncbi:MAG: Asp23/Gls24 family envelope stress response protein [Egibacteraceae bacterium]
MTDVATRTSADAGQVGFTSRSALEPQALVPRAERGATSIADSVVTKIASIAAREVDGVTGLGGSLSSAVDQVVGRIRGKEHATAGVAVEVGSTQAAVDLIVRMQYPVAIHEVADQIRQNVIDRIGTLVGLEVVEVNIAVIDLVFPEEHDEQSPPASRVQ